MRDQRAERLADILVDYSVEVREGEKVLIRGNYVAEPLILAVYERCLQRGAHVMLRPEIPEAAPVFYRFASEHQLDYIWEPDKWLYDNLDVMITILSETNTRKLTRANSESQVRASLARKPLMKTYMDRAAAGSLRWTLTLFPTEAYAMDARMSLEEYEEFYYKACFVDRDDPVAEWRAFAEKHKKLIAWLEGRNEIHIEAEGTDLILEVGGRTFIPADGKENFPDGEIFTGPHEDKTRGHITFSFPALYRGQAVDGVRLEFENGKVVDARADRNEEFLIKTLDTDPGARILGELGIGTNFGITDSTGELLLDEKMGGTVHLAVGASYPESGGVNESAVHWDMVCDLRKGGRVTVDGDPFVEDGRFVDGVIG